MPSPLLLHDVSEQDRQSFRSNPDRPDPSASLLPPQFHHQVLIHDMLSVLHANVAVTDPLVICVKSGSYVQDPHTGFDLSNL